MDMFSYLLGRSSGGGKGALKIQIVEELPTTGEANVLYLVPRQVTKTRNVFDEYLYVNEAWELVGTTDIDISGKQDKMQFDSLPTASADNVGKIVQYIGTTNANYTNGYFYICLSDGGDPATYSWENINVQAGGGSSAVVITASNYNTQAIIDAVDAEFQKYLNGEEYHIYAYRENFGSPVYFCRLSSSVYYLGSPFVNSGAGYNGSLYLTYRLVLNLTVSSNHITNIGFERLYSEEFGGNSSGFYLKTKNFSRYDVTGNLNPAHKLYVDNSAISKANGIELYSASQTYSVDDIVYYFGTWGGEWHYYKCIQQSQGNLPTNTNYWTEITLTADQSTLTTKKYVDDLVGNINTVLATLTTPSNNGGN